MARAMSGQVEKQIVDILRTGETSTIVIVGNPGIGKTWIARKVSAYASRNGLCDIILWAYLNRGYDEKAFYESIGRQLSLLTPSKEWEHDDNEEVEKEEKENLEDLKEKISAKLAGKKVLLVLDEEGSKMTEWEIMELLVFPCGKLVKLITAVNEDGRHKSTDEDPKDIKEVIEVLTPSTENSLSLLKERIGPDFFDDSGIELPAKDFIIKNKGLTPAATVRLAKAIVYGGSGVQVLEQALEESSGDGNYSFGQLVCSGYNKVPDGVLIDFCWKDSHFFRDHGSVHFGELIAYWILEGYLGPVDSFGKAYKEGHHILMELIECQMLKKVEDDYLTMERAVRNLDQRHCSGFVRTTSLGLATLFEDSEWDGIGGITWADGMMKSLPSGKNKKNITALLLHGNCLSKKVQNNFFQSEPDLHVVALFKPRLKSLLPLFPRIQDLKVLVLRSCNWLVDIKLIQKLKNLSALEISGAGSLISIPDDIFLGMTRLRSLNLNSLQIEVLPKSFYSLTELRWVILKGCSLLREIDSLKNFGRLTVLNLSGATSLDSFRDKNLKPFKELQMLDLSNTNIKPAPIFRDISWLTHLSLRDCKRIDRLPSILSLTNLQVLDLSGSKIREFQDPSFKNIKGLKILNVSRTTISRLPSDISNLCQLYFRDCLQVKQFPITESLKYLEVLDLSGATALKKIDTEYFEHLTNLQVLKLSETSVEELPPLSTLCNLRQLILSCSSLVKLPALNGLTKLEVMDLSGCKALTVLEGESFESMTCLQRLNLSETNIKTIPPLEYLTNLHHLSLRKCLNLRLNVEPLKYLKKLEELNLCGINSFSRADFLEHLSQLHNVDLSETLLEELPSLSNHKNLVHLSLRGCQQLTTIPSLEALTKLKFLDLSGTAIGRLQSLTNLCNLRQLLLKDCLNLQEFQNRQMLDLSQAIIEELPNGNSELSQLRRLYLPKQCSIGADTRERHCSPVKQWGISILPRSFEDNNRPFISISNTEFFQLLNRDPQMWNTSFKQFQFSVRPIEEQNKIGSVYLDKDEFVFRDTYFQARHFPCSEEGRLLEILGFHNFPEGLDVVLSRAEFVFLFDNPFLKCLSELGANNMEVMAGCWIESCVNMESVFNVEKVEDTAKMEKNLVILWISYAIRLESIYGGNLQYEGFRNLKRLYLDCCPKLPFIFSSSQQPEKLEILHVKFCDTMERLFEPNSKDCTLPKLRELRLLELPKLESIGCELPSLQILEVGECPMLLNVLSVHQLPTKLKILKIKCCDKLKTLFELKTAADATLPNLHVLHLWRLPELMTYGAKLPSILQHPIVELCPKLEREH